LAIIMRMRSTDGGRAGIRVAGNSNKQIAPVQFNDLTL
jgi:hypothetical protein